MHPIDGYHVIIAHGPGCRDGATAAWAYWRSLPDEIRGEFSTLGGFYGANGETVSEEDEEKPVRGYTHPNSLAGALKLQQEGWPLVFAFAQPSDVIPVELVQGRNVLIMDLDLSDGLVPVVEVASHVTLLDHHPSSQATVSKNGDLLLNRYRHKFRSYVDTRKTESGATLAWKSFQVGPVPPLVEVVRIGDNWQWNDSPELYAREFLKSTFIHRCFRSFWDIEEVYQRWEELHEEYVRDGALLQQQETAYAKKIAKQCDLGYLVLNDGTVHAIAYTQANVLHSEAGSLIRWYAEKRFASQLRSETGSTPISCCATWNYASSKGMVIVSLRDPLPGVDLSYVARNVRGGKTGGGHVAAAGFSFSGIENFHTIIQKYAPATDPQLLQ